MCYQLFSKTTGPNCMKFSGMICHHPRTNRLDFGSDQVKGQGQDHEKVKNYRTELHEIFRDDLSSSKDQSIRFWKRSGQRSRPRSRKGQKCIFVITRCFRSIHMKPMPKCSLFNSLSSDMVTNVALAEVCTLPSARSSSHSFMVFYFSFFLVYKYCFCYLFFNIFVRIF